MNRENKGTTSLNATAEIFFPRVIQAQDREQNQVRPRYVYNPYNIMQTPHHAGLDHVYQPYSIFESTNRAVPGMGVSWALQRPPIVMQARKVGLGEYGTRIVGSDWNAIEEAKYTAKQNVKYSGSGRFRVGIEEGAWQEQPWEGRAGVERARTLVEAQVRAKPANQPKERSENSMTSRARGRKAVRERKKAEEALVEQARAAAEEEEAATRGRLEIPEE